MDKREKVESISEKLWEFHYQGVQKCINVDGFGDYLIVNGMQLSKNPIPMHLIDFGDLRCHADKGSSEKYNSIITYIVSLTLLFIALLHSYVSQC